MPRQRTSRCGRRQRLDDGEDEMDTKEPEETQQQRQGESKRHGKASGPRTKPACSYCSNQDISQGSAPNQRETEKARTGYPQAYGSNTTQVSFPGNGTTGGQHTGKGKGEQGKGIEGMGMVADGYNISLPQLGVTSKSGHGDDWSWRDVQTG